MTALASFVGETPMLYDFLSILGSMLLTLICVLAVPTVFRVPLRRSPLLWLVAGLISCAVALMRQRCYVSGNESLIDLYEVLSLLQPYLCVLLLVPFRHILKGFATSLGYVFLEAVKYMILVLFFHYDNNHVNDPLELLVECIIHLAAFLAVLWFLRRRDAAQNLFAPILLLDPMMYVLAVMTLAVFMATLALVGTSLTIAGPGKILLLLLNLPLLIATISFAATRIIRTKAAEETYKLQLAQQIQHYEQMEKMNEDLRLFRHDFPKKLRPLMAFVEDGRTQQAKEILTQLNGFVAESGKQYHTGNYRLDTVLFCQQQIAQQDDITIDFTFGSVFPNEGIEPDDIYTIFPNALDNAIEACRKVGKPCTITINSRIVNNEVFVTIENPVAGTVTVRNGQPQTDKDDKRQHGYGYRNMKKAAAKYGSDNLDFHIEDGMFILRFNLKFSAENA